MTKLRVIQLQTIALFDNKLADETPKTPIKAKPHLKAMPDKKSEKLFTLDFEKTNSNLKAKIWQDTNEFNNLKQEIKQF